VQSKGSLLVLTEVATVSTLDIETLGHPMFSCLQHHCFFQLDHPNSQFTMPAWQSTGQDVVVMGQPRRSFWQHHICFPRVHDTAQDDSPAVQSYGRAVKGSLGQARCSCSQHHRFFHVDQPISQFRRPAWQSTAQEVVVTGHPRPAALQQ